MEYPCRGCIVFGICSEGCEKINRETIGQELFDVFITKNHCPDCGGSDVFGPESWTDQFVYTNIQCTNCFSKFEINAYYNTIS